jgi:tRNA threonylcarbamoyladenosine biosynthesis protein TsaB
MTYLLAIETSTEVATIALLAKGEIISRELSGVQTHSHGVLPAVKDLFDEASIALSQCDVIAFGCGPGAFTGLRTACGVVQGLAFGLDIPVVPVVSLRAMAQAAHADDSRGDFVCVLDASMNEVYWAHYQAIKSIDGAKISKGWREMHAPRLAQATEAFDYALLHGVDLVLGKGVAFTDELAQTNKTLLIKQAMPHAKELVQLGLQDFIAGLAVSAELAQPLYLRNKIAQTTLERLHARTV